jgi:hypothetical protein
MLPILQLNLDLPDEPTPAPDWIEEILQRHPELERARCPVPAYDARLRTSTCLACRRLIADCPGWNRKQA